MATTAYWHTMPIWATMSVEVPTMPTRNVVLTEHHETFIKGLVQTGRYKNASEVLRESLRLMENKEQEQAVKLQNLRRRLELAEQDLECGRVQNYTATFLDEIDADDERGPHKPSMA